MNPHEFASNSDWKPLALPPLEPVNLENPTMIPSGSYLLVYDIAKDRTRTRLSKICEGFGLRVQKSVFECRLSKAMKERLWQRLRNLPLGETDRVSLYPLGRTGGRQLGEERAELLSEERHSVVV